MIRLLTILLIITGSAKAQCDTTPIYGIRLKFDVALNTGRWNYCNPNGVPAWSNVKGYDSTLIPKGGWAERVTVNKTIQGYGDLKVSGCQLVLTRWMDSNHKDIDGSVRNWYFYVKQ